MKRHRGLRRYYKNLSIQNELDKITWLDFEKTDTWFDNWHIHFDWYGYGNNSFRKRSPHLDKLFRHFDLLIEKTRNIKTDFQLYTIILDFDSASDALFLHTPNPNNTQFPFRVEDLKHESNLNNKALKEYLENLTGFEKLYGKAGESFCLLYKKGIGADFIL
jgi:hypothetical protein